MPTPNLNEVRKKLDASRMNLLDLSPRNKLLNYRTPKATGVDVVGEDPKEVFRILVIEGKKMTFESKKVETPRNIKSNVLPEQEEGIINYAYPNQYNDSNSDVDIHDTYLNTNIPLGNLRTRLLKTWRNAHTSLEEQGLNVLFLVLGMLEWYESDVSQEVRKAPLILVPVLIERTQGDRFKVSYDGTEIGMNLSLGAKLKQEFRINLPDVPAETEDVNVNEYFGQVQKAISTQKRWRVDEKGIALGFFSYAKYIMFKDLEGEKWPESSKPWMHDVVGALLDCGFGDDKPIFSEEDNVDYHRPVESISEVCSADSAQVRAILQTRSGQSMVIEGPPGTGKSQTITNLIADAIVGGKKVLFVAEKRAALDVVWRNLEKAEIQDACLELHSNKAKKKEFYQKLNQTMQVWEPKIKTTEAQLAKYDQLRDSLNKYCNIVHGVLPNRGITPFEAVGRLLKCTENAGAGEIRFAVMNGWSQIDFENALELVKKVQNAINRTGVPCKHPFFGVGLRRYPSQGERDAILHLIEEVLKAMEEIRCSTKEISKALELPIPNNMKDVGRLSQVLHHFAKSPLLKSNSPDFSSWESQKTKLKTQIETGLGISEIEITIQGNLKSHPRESDVNKAIDILEKYTGKWWRYFVRDYRSSICLLKQICEYHLPKNLREKRSLINAIIEYQHGCKIMAEQVLNRLLNTLDINKNVLSLESMGFNEQSLKLRQWQEEISRLDDLIQFNILSKEAKDKGLESLTQVVVRREYTDDQLVNEFKKVWYSGVLKEAYEQYPELAEFFKASHEDAINSFVELDKVVMDANKAKVAYKHWSSVPRYNAGGSVGLLNKEFNKKTRHKPIRLIMSECFEAIQALKPVFMMSPLSVAMYLPPNGPHFDMVIFDEASQIKPEDAFGAIIRGKQTIVIGDTKQLPPTSFFDKLTQTEDDDESDNYDWTGAFDSILSLMSGVIPQISPRRRYLRWHYRSHHDSLIATSNCLFYDERLVIFPHPDRERKGIGLVFNYFPGTVYGRGGTRKNQEEARKVVEAIAKHAHNNPKLSLGVATFSISQQEAIQDELERLRISEPSIAELDRLHPNEPLFVKNLESVQGDERDVIFISIGYGKDNDGFVTMNFGPLNIEGGERRLNVLITRARVRCEVFTNLRASDLRVDEKTPSGVRALRTFLHFAETGELDVPMKHPDPMSPFEDEVIKRLKEQGYLITPQVGCAGFYIDIGVHYPGNPSRFILGIECDGRKYHSAQSARDRDRLRQEVLENRGWRICRIWSTDWYRNPENELKRVSEEIEQAITAGADTMTKEGDCPKSFLIERTPMKNASATTVIPYTRAKLHIKLYGRQLRDISPDALANWVVEIVRIEEPVHIDEIIHRMRDAAGLGRAGGAMYEAVLLAIRYAVKHNRIEFKHDFCSMIPLKPPIVRNRSGLSPESKKIEYVHTKEIETAIQEVIRDSFGISKEEAIHRISRLLGFDRSTATVCNSIEKVIQGLLARQSILEHAGQLKIPTQQ